MEEHINTYPDKLPGQAATGHRGAAFFSVTDIAAAINSAPAYDKGFCLVEIIGNEAGEPADYRFLKANALFEELTGFKGASGKRINELPEADRAAWQELLRQATRSQNPLHFEYHHQRNGRWLDIQIYCYAGQMVIALDDITGRKRATQMLRKSESFLQKAFSTETVGVLFFTLDGRMKDTNEAFVRMSGYSREELRTLPWQVLTPPEFVDVVMRVGQDLATMGETPPYEKQLIRKDGSRWWGLFAPARLTENGSESECVEFVVDITESKHAEQALRESEERLRLATDVARMYSWEYDMKTKLTKYSGNVERITGLKPGADFKENLELVHPEDRHLMEKAFERAMQTNGKFDFEMRLLPRDKRSDWYRISGMIVYNGKREPVRIIGISQKITRQKELERQKDEFIGIASHELRTPVTSIKIYAEILEERLNEAEDRENAVLVNKLKAQTDRLTKLVYDLLDTTRIFEDRFLMQPEFFDLNDLIEENVEELQGIACNNKLIIQAGDIQPVLADRERIGQVLTNLISNAVKYSPAGSDVIISSEEAEDGVIVRIRDFGIGMSPETQKKVFERFYRAGDTHVNMNTFPGLGLGLYIASEIIKRHHGVIGLESKAGEGSVFYFKLPYNRPAET